jgi:voltage-gated potassium channel
METLHRTIRLLYTGRSQRAQWFRYALVVFDTLTILYFIVSVSWPQTALLSAVDTGLGVVILADLAARFWISDDRRKECLKLYTIADLLVVASLLLAPVFTDDLAFLRILRGLRLIHSYHLIRDLRRESRFFRLHEDAVLAAVHLFVFIFVMASLVFVVSPSATRPARAPMSTRSTSPCPR